MTELKENTIWNGKTKCNFETLTFNTFHTFESGEQDQATYKISLALDLIRRNKVDLLKSFEIDVLTLEDYREIKQMKKEINL